jgi:DNA polymerase III subunit delta'
MQFKEVIGQSVLKQRLAEMVQQNRLSHALLFVEKEGSGGLALAIAFAQYVLCHTVNKKATSTNVVELFENATSNTVIPIEDACGTCPACLKVQQLTHPDLHFTYPVVSKKSGDKPISTDYMFEWRSFVAQYAYGNVYDWLQLMGAENKQGNITAHECNDIMRKLSLKSFESGYKILIIWMPEYLGNESNKLLKLIEEPPPNTLFILVTSDASLLLATVISRCQLVKIHALADADIKQALINRAHLPETQAAPIAALAQGNYREALQLLQHAEIDWQAQLRDWLNAILKTGPAAQLLWIEEMHKQGREKQKQFLRYFNHLLQQSIRLRMIHTNSFEKDSSSKETDFADRLNKLASIEQQEAIVEALDKATYYIERNAHAKMLFHALSIKLYHIIANKKIVSTW